MPGGFSPELVADETYGEGNKLPMFAAFLTT